MARTVTNRLSIGLHAVMEGNKSGVGLDNYLREQVRNYRGWSFDKDTNGSDRKTLVKLK